jgi:hypothetical protein
MMPRLLLTCLALLLALAGGGRSAVAQQRGGVIVGRVEDAVTAAPLAGATVRVVGSDLGATTDAQGRFTLREVPLGIVALEVRRIGYRPVTRTDIAVSPAKPAELRIALSVLPADLAAITVRPEAFADLAPPTAPVSTQTYTSEEVRRQPGAQEDVLRAVSVAPGVGVTSGGRNDLIVRGGAPFENRFLVDGIEVPNLNHFGSQGSTGGPISIVNIRFIDEVSLSAGGFGAAVGDRTSSVTALTLRDGNRERVAGELNLAASQVGAVVEGPLGRDASFFANVRQSYLDLLFAALGQSFIPAYTDAIVKAAWTPGTRDRVSLLGIGARGTVRFDNDEADDRVDNARILAPAQDQLVLGLSWRRLLPEGVLTTTLSQTGTWFRSTQRDSLLQPLFSNRSGESETSLRSTLTQRLAATLTLDAGAQAVQGRATYALTLDGRVRRDEAGLARPLGVDSAFASSRLAGHAAVTWEPDARWRVTLGGRADRYDYAAPLWRLAPRAAVSLTPSPALGTFTVSGGRYWQAPAPIWLMGDAGNPRTLRPLRADHLVAGWARRVGREAKVQVEAYHKRYADYPARVWRPNAVLQPTGFDDAGTDIPFGLEPLRSAGRGEASGVELFAQKRLGALPVYGQAALSLNRTRFTGLDGTARRGAFDTPVLMNALLGWRPTARLEVAARVRGASGLPETPFLLEGPAAGTLDFSRLNGERRDAFAALDLRVDRRFTLGRTQLIAFLDVQNVALRRARGAARWDPRAAAVERPTGIGVLPTIGLNWEF